MIQQSHYWAYTLRKLGVEKDTCTPMFIATLFTIARTWKQPRCPLTGDWIKKLCYIYTMEYYSANKKEHIWGSSNEVDEPRAYYTKWSKSEREREILSCLENPMDGGAWWASVHGVVKSQTRLSDFTFTFCFHALEKEMATHSSVLAWRIPGTGEPGGLQSMGSHRVGHDWSDLAAAAATHIYKI